MCQVDHLSYHIFFFFNDTATTEIYTLSLHDALPILPPLVLHAFVSSSAAKLRDWAHQIGPVSPTATWFNFLASHDGIGLDRKSTRLNSSHANISYAVFCLKKKKQTNT